MQSNTEGKGSVLKMRGCKYSEYPSYWGQISNSEFLNIQTAALPIPNSEAEYLHPNWVLVFLLFFRHFI